MDNSTDLMGSRLQVRYDRDLHFMISEQVDSNWLGLVEGCFHGFEPVGLAMVRLVMVGLAMVGWT